MKRQGSAVEEIENIKTNMRSEMDWANQEAAEKNQILFKRIKSKMREFQAQTAAWDSLIFNLDN